MATVENHLIEQLPRNDRRRLLAVCEPVHLIVSEVLCEPGCPTVMSIFRPMVSFRW